MESKMEIKNMENNAEASERKMSRSEAVVAGQRLSQIINPSHIDDLPSEVLLMILTCIPPASLLNGAALVCRKWHNLCMDKAIWRRNTSWFHWGEPWRFKEAFIAKAFGEIKNLDLVIRHQKSLVRLWGDLEMIGRNCTKLASLALTVNIIDKQVNQGTEGTQEVAQQAIDNLIHDIIDDEPQPSHLPNQHPSQQPSALPNQQPSQQSDQLPNQLPNADNPEPNSVNDLSENLGANVSNQHPIPSLPPGLEKPKPSMDTYVGGLGVVSSDEAMSDDEALSDKNLDSKPSRLVENSQPGCCSSSAFSTPSPSPQPPKYDSLNNDPLISPVCPSTSRVSRDHNDGSASSSATCMTESCNNDDLFCKAMASFQNLTALYLNLCNSATTKILEELVRNGVSKTIRALDVQCMSLEKLTLMPSFPNLSHLQFSRRAVDENNAVWETPDHQTPIISEAQADHLKPLNDCASLKTLSIGNKISASVLDTIFAEEASNLRNLTRLDIWILADFAAIKRLLTRLNKINYLDITLSVLEDDRCDNTLNPFQALSSTATYFSLVMSDEESVNGADTIKDLLLYFAETCRSHPNLEINTSAFIDVGFVEYEDIFQAIVEGPNMDVSGGTFPLRVDGDWQRLQKLVAEFKDLVSVEIDFQSINETTTLSKPEKQFFSKMTDLLLNVDSTNLLTNTRNVVNILSLFSEIRQLTMEMYTPEVTLVNKPSPDGITFRDLPCWEKLECLKINTNTPMSSDLARFIFLNCPNLRHIELKAMPGEMPQFYLKLDLLAYLPYLKKLKFAYLQLKTGDSHLLKLKHFQEDFETVLLQPLTKTFCQDFIIYLDIHQFRNKMEYVEAAEHNSFCNPQGHASFLIQKIFGHSVVSERHLINSFHDEVPPSSQSQAMLSFVQCQNQDHRLCKKCAH